MRTRTIPAGLLALVFLATALACAPAEEATAPEETAPVADSGAGQSYPNAEAMSLETVFENDYIVVQRALATPGVWTGEHGHAGNQFSIPLAPATMTTRADGEETAQEFEAGGFVWVDAVESHDHAITSETSGTTLLATIKMSPSGALGREPGDAFATMYPNAVGVTVLDNEHVIVSRYDVDPGSWTGIHTHDGDEASFILSDSIATFRVDGEDTERAFAAGDVIWTDAVEHDHGNTGDTVASYYVVKLR